MEISVERIKRIREKSGLSQDKFSIALNISPWTLRKWEQGIRKPDDAAIVLLKIIEKYPELLDEIHDLD